MLVALITMGRLAALDTEGDIYFHDTTWDNGKDSYMEYEYFTAGPAQRCHSFSWFSDRASYIVWRRM